MRRNQLLVLRILIVAGVLASAPVRLSSQQGATVRIDSDDIGGVVASDKGPSAVIVILLWESKEHLARWRFTESYKSFRAAVAPLQTAKSHGGFYAAETI